MISRVFYSTKFEENFKKLKFCFILFIMKIRKCINKCSLKWQISFFSGLENFLIKV